MKRNRPTLLLAWLLPAVLLISSGCGGGGTGTEEPAETAGYSLADIEGYWQYDKYDNYYYLGLDGTFQYYTVDGLNDEGSFTLAGDVLTFAGAAGSYDDMTILSTELLRDATGDTLRRFVPDEGTQYTADDVAGYWQYDKYDNYYYLDVNGTFQYFTVDGLNDEGTFFLEGDALTFAGEVGSYDAMTVLSTELLVDSTGDTLRRFDPGTGSYEEHFFTMDDVAGYWSYDSGGYVLALYDTGLWEGYDLTGRMLDRGTYMVTDNQIERFDDAGNTYVVIYAPSLEQFIDETGDTLSRFDPAVFTGEEPDPYDSAAEEYYEESDYYDPDGYYEDGEWYESNDADW